jgi:hypothetical protein
LYYYGKGNVDHLDLGRLVFIGYGIAVVNFFSDKSKGRNRSYNIGFGLVFGTFALFFGINTIPHNFSTFAESKSVYNSKAYTVMEGVVENFDPMPYSGHRDETFTLNGVKFSYSVYDNSYYGFNTTKSHGRPIRQGKRFRLSYFNSGGKNIILKIEASN